MRHLMPLLAAAAMVLSTVPAYADLGDQLAKLLADDGASGDQFGWSVAISPDGIGAIVGAYLDDDNGTNSGSAYLFDTTTGRQIAKLLPNDGAAEDFFGTSVAISGATAIVGAYGDDDNGNFSGSAYLFDAAAPGRRPWDLNGSGDVNVLDLLALLAAWGPCPTAPCPHMCGFDDDCIIGILDLLILLANWGPCP